MSQPIYKEEYESNPIVLGDWRADGNGVLLAGTKYLRGSVLGKITIDGVNKGKLTISTNTVSDGSEFPYAILLDDVDATLTDLNGPILLGGKVDKNLLVLGDGHTLESIETQLRDKNIYLATKG